MVEHLTEGLDLNALLTLKMEKSLLNLEGARRLAVSKIDWQSILLLKTLMRNKASRCLRLVRSVLTPKRSKITS
jgi:hypothetical protein